MDRDVLRQLSYGVYAVTTLDGAHPVGCIVNSAMQVTSRPPTVAVSIAHRNHTCGALSTCGRFALTICAETTSLDTIETLGYKSFRDMDKFGVLSYQPVDGLPVLADAVGYGLFKVIDTMVYVTHTVFLGEMYEGAMLAGGVPMTYAYYHDVSAKRSHLAEVSNRGAQDELRPKEERMAGQKVWRCTVCGYIYEGDTPFEELPDEWTCPLCGASKSQFEEVEA